MSTPSNRFHLTLKDPESGLTLRQENPGYIEIGINEENVEFSIPLTFLKEFVRVMGGSLSFPDRNLSLPGAPLPHSSTYYSTDGTEYSLSPSGYSAAYLCIAAEHLKIPYIKAVRAAVGRAAGIHNTPSLKAVRDLVLEAVKGNQPIAFRGPVHQTQEFIRHLDEDGFKAVEVPAKSPQP